MVQNCDELFDRDELSAVPDTGWPDCFNSSVFVYVPSMETFWDLIVFAERQGSFDGMWFPNQSVNTLIKVKHLVFCCNL